MAIKKQLNKLLTQEMDRKNFLKYSGGLMLAVLGITKLLDIIQINTHDDKKAVSSDHKEQSASTSGYGSSAYGS